MRPGYPGIELNRRQSCLSSLKIFHVSDEGKLMGWYGPCAKILIFSALSLGSRSKNQEKNTKNPSIHEKNTTTGTTS